MSPQTVLPLLFVWTSLAAAGEAGTEPPRGQSSRSRTRTTAGMTVFGVDAGASTSPETAPYGSIFTAVLRGTQYGFGHAWWSAGFDAGLGLAVASPGFAYDLGVRVGPGHWFGDNFALAVYTGVGLDGVTESQPFALQTPAGLALQVNVLSGLTFALRGEGNWAYATSRVPRPLPLGLDGFKAKLDVGVAKRSAATDRTSEFYLSFGLFLDVTGTANVLGVHLGTSAATDPW